MSLPSNINEAEFLAIVRKIAAMLRNQFGYVHGSKDDFHQQVAIWCLEALPKYDPARPLAGFLFSHVRNRALNVIRDKVTRFDPPCKKCHSGNPCGSDGDFCSKYVAWFKRNRNKSDLSRVRSYNQATQNQSHTETAENEAIEHEFADEIESKLPLGLVDDFRKMLCGVEVAREREYEVQKAVAKIVGKPELVRGRPKKMPAAQPASASSSPPTLEG